MREIIYIHIPKTGGTSLREAIHLGMQKKDYRVLQDYEFGPRRSPLLKSIPDGVKTSDYLRRGNTDSRRLFIVGHFLASKYTETFHPASFMALVREPFSRIYSHFTHITTRGKYNKPFETFIHEERYRNIQTK